MITILNPMVPSAVYEIEKELWFIDIHLAEMSKQHLEMKAYARQWMTAAPRDRYEKRVGSANKFFGPMDWYDIIAFAQAHRQDWVYDPWNFFCMLEHLSETFPAKVEECVEIKNKLSLAASTLNRMLERGIPDDEADTYLGLLEVQTIRFVEMIDGIRADVIEQLQSAIKVSQELDRIGIWKH